MTENNAEETSVDLPTARNAYAEQMRSLYAAYGDAHGGLSLRKLEELSAGLLTHGWLSEILSGKRFPTLAYTRTYVRVLTSTLETADPDAQERLSRSWKTVDDLKHTGAKTTRQGNAVPSDEDSVADLTKELADHAQQVADLTQQVAELTTQVTDLTAQLADRTQQASDLTWQVANLTLQVADLERQLEELTRETGTLVSDLRDSLYARWPAEGLLLPTAQGMSSVAFRPDGRLLAVGCADGLLRTWDPDSASPLGRSSVGQGKPVRCVAFSDDGSLLVAGSDDGTVQLADPTTVRPLGDPLIQLKSAVLALAISPLRPHATAQWRYCLAVGDQTGKVRIWNFADLPQGDPNFVIEADGAVRALAFVPGHDALAVATEHSRVTVHGYVRNEVWAGATVFSDPENAAVRSLAFDSVTGDLIIGDAVHRVHLLTLSADGQFRVERRREFQVRFPVRSVAACPVSQLLAIAGEESVLLRELGLDASADTSIPGDVQSVAFGPGGKLIAIAMGDGTTRLHSVDRARSRVGTMVPVARKSRWRR